MTHRSTVAKAALITVLITLAVLPQIATASYDEGSKDMLWSELTDLFAKTVELGRQGIDVSEITHNLSQALSLISKGDDRSLEEASQILSHVRDEITRIDENKWRILLINDATKYSLVALILSVPVLTYFLLPRAYVIVWFKTRRRWVVEK